MNKYFIALSLLIFLALSGRMNGQTVYTDPLLPLADEPVTVYFNATGTPLEDYSGDVYTHTGVTVNAEQWQFVIGNWGDNNQPELEKIGTDLYSLEITPSIRDFYDVPEVNLITEMCFVFRAESGSPQSSDYFVDVYQDELAIVFQEPTSSGFFIEQSDDIAVHATSPLADSMFLFVGDVMVMAVAGITIQHILPVELLGEVWVEHWVTVIAKDATDMVEASFSAIPVPPSPVAELPAGVRDGINYLDASTVILSLYAPSKQFVFGVGEFNSWVIDESSYMYRTPDGDRYWIQLEDLIPGKEYAFQYFVNGEFSVTDPYSEKILDPWNDPAIPQDTYPGLKPYPEGQSGLVSVLQTNQLNYEWQNNDFEPPAITDLVVYELLIRDFIQNRNYQALIDKIPYLKGLGVNAIELMPVNEFDGNSSWGYNPNHYFAVDKYYGTENDFKEFIDLCHGEGIAVILDVVFNHATGQSPYVKLYWDEQTNRPSADSPFYNEEPTHDFNVFHDMNHESAASKTYISRAVKYWLEEFRVDGYRFDLSKGFTQKYTLGNSAAMGEYDQDRIDILTAYADSAWAVNPDAYIILEHFAENSEEEVLSNHGCMLWGNANYNYNEATMGYNEDGKSDFSWLSYQKRGWDNPHVMGYMESHDEERLMAKNLAYGNSSGNYIVTELNVALKRIQLAAAFFFTIPGPKMIWQFGELGYEYNINYPGEMGEDDHRTDPKPILWYYEDEWNREVIYEVFAELITLKKTEPVFKTTDYSLSVNGETKTIHLNHASMNVTVLGNFDVVDNSVSPQFQHTGYWYDYFSGDSLDVIDVAAAILLAPGEYRVYTDKKFPRPEIGLSINDFDSNILESTSLYPNPSAKQVSISFELNEKTNIGVRIYNNNGQLIRDLGAQMLQAGPNVVVWDGKSEAAVRVDPGIYFCELRSNKTRHILKVVMQ